MPYKSEAQRGYLHAQHPEIAARWDDKYGGAIAKRRFVKKVKRRRRRKK